MIINGNKLLKMAPIKDMISEKRSVHGLSWGLSEVGYDFRLKEKITFIPPKANGILNLMKKLWEYGLTYKQTEEHKLSIFGGTIVEDIATGQKTFKLGRTALASSIEYFNIPENLWCEFRNKSTHARNWIDASLCTDGEPGWNGHLTIELIFHGSEPLVLEEGTPILKAVFHEIAEPVKYTGKYQNQPDKPVGAILKDLHPND